MSMLIVLLARVVNSNTKPNEQVSCVQEDLCNHKETAQLLTICPMTNTDEIFFDHLHQSPTRTIYTVSTNQTCSNATSLNKTRGGGMMWRIIQSSHFSTRNFSLCWRTFDDREARNPDLINVQLQIVWIESRGGNDLLIPRCSHGLL